MKKKFLLDFDKNRTRKTKRWLSWLSFCMMLFWAQLGFAQQTYQIGSGTGTSSYIPLYYNYDYNYSQTIYTAAELNAQGATATGQITKIKFLPKAGVTTTYWKDWVVYLGNTTKASFTSNTDWVAVGNLTQVFNGSLPANTTANQWVEITLTTPFTWDGTSNIVVAVDENTPDYSTTSLTWGAYTLAPSTGNKGIYKYQDDTNINPSSPPSGTRTNTVAQIQFVGDLSPGCSGTTVGGTATATPATGNSGSSFTASATGMTSGASGLQYQWQKSTDGEVTWTDIAGATSVSSTIVAETGSVGKVTHYRLKVTCTNSSETSYSNSVTHTLVKVYCTPTGAANNTAEIRNFTLSNLNNSSAASEGTAGYKDYSGTVAPADLSIGLPYVATILSGTDTGNHGAAIWIDYNNNGTFETDEKVAWIGNTIQPNTTASFPSFTVPNTVITGVYKLRVMYVYGVSGADLTPCSTTSTYAEIEDYSVNVLPAPTCLAPTGLTLDTVSTDSADISWAAVGNASNYTWAVFADNANPTTDTPVATGTTAGAIANATGLNSATAYDFYVKSDCTVDGVSLWSSKLDFITACATPDAPTNITFTSVSASATTVNYDAPGAAPTGYTIFRSTSNIAPDLTDGTTYTVNNTTPVASLTNGVNTYYCVNNGTALTVTITSGLTSNTEYYYYVFSRNSTGCTPLYSTTALTSSQATAPATPGTATVSAITQNGATISWVASVAGGDFAPLNYTLEVYTDSGYTTYVAGSPFTVGTAVTYDVTGLAPSTTYYYRIKAYNGLDSTYRTGSFTTTQIPAVLPFTEDFEGTIDWTIVNGTQTNKWFVGSATNNGGTQSLYVSNDNGVTNTYGHTASTVHAYRDIAIPNNADVVNLSFDWKAAGESTYDYIRVWAVPTAYTPAAGTQTSVGNSGGVQIGSYFNLNSNFTTANYQIPVTTYQGQTIRLVFEWRNDGNGGTTTPAGAIDNVNISVVSCPAPTGSATTGVTHNAANFSWTAVGNATEYTWAVFADNANPNTDTPVATGTTSGTTANATGLNPTTAYDFYVKSDCAVNGVSNWSSKLDFTTMVAPATIPWNEGFTTTATPTGWTIGGYTIYAATTTAGSPATAKFSDTDTSVIRRNPWSSSATGNFTTTTVGMVSTSDVLSFKYKLINYNDDNVPAVNSGKFVVEVSANGGAYTQIDEVMNNGIAGWHEKEYSLAAYAGQVVKIRITDTWLATGADYFIGFDNFFIGTPPITATTWADNNGTLEWSNGTPNSTLDAIIDADYTDAAFEAKNLTVNSGKKLTVNSSVKAVDITNNGTIEVSNGANFVQTGTFTPGTGSEFNVKVTTLNVKRLAYISWSSPVADSQNLKDFSKGNNPLSVGTLDNRFYTYNSGSSMYSVVSDPATTSFAPKTGYLIRTPNDFQLSGTAAPFYGTFKGTTPNSGTLTSAVSTTATEEYVFVGNPYPGAMDIAEFFTANTGLEPNTMYVWNSQAELDSNTNQYGGDVYYTRSNGGWTPNTVTNTSIVAGQGFFVVKPAAFAGDISFNNDMRAIDNSGTFVKAAALDRFWLELKSAATGTTSSSQVLLGFHQQATSGYDAGWDAKIMQMSQDVMYTTVSNNNLVIDIHGNFVNTDKFFATVNTSAAGSYNISLAGKDGIFNNGQKIYIKDMTTGLTGEVSQGTFNFVSNGGVEPNRFEISFIDNSVLATVETTTKDVEIYGANSTVYVKADKNIKSVKVYDLSGRMIKSVEKTNGNSVEIPVSAVKMVLVSVETADGKIISQKIKL